jgi:UPF0755 protein
MTLTKRGRIVTALFILLAMFVVAAGAGLFYLRSIGVGGESDPSKTVEITIPKGATAQRIGEVLEEAGIIESAFAFRVATWLGEGAEEIQAGIYEIDSPLTATDALETLRGSAPILNFVNVTFPEGSWLEDFARIVGEKTHVNGDKFLALVE